MKFLLLESLQKKIMIISQNNYQTYNYMYYISKDKCCLSELYQVFRVGLSVIEDHKHGWISDVIDH